MLKTFEEGLDQIKKYWSFDGDLSSKEKREEFITSVMNRNKTRLSRSSKKDKTLNDNETDWTQEYRARKRKALLNIGDHIESFDIRNNKYINKKAVFYCMNSIPIETYEILDRKMSKQTSLAIAIWICDAIDDDVLLENEFSNIPESKYVIDQQLVDTQHSMQVIGKVASILEKRNDEEKFWNDPKTLYQNYPDSENRKAFTKLMDFIPKDKIDEAVSNYQKLFDETLASASVALKPLLNEYQNARISLEDHQIKEATPIIFKKRYLPTENLWQFEAFPKLGRVEKAYADIIEINHKLPLVIGTKKDEAKKIYPEETLVSDYIPVFIDNPYEILFAKLYLADIGDDRPWCYFPGVIMMYSALCSLPYIYYTQSEHQKEAELPLWNRRNHVVKTENQEIISTLAQEICTICGVIPPRRITLSEDEFEALGDSSLSQDVKDAVLIASALSKTKTKKIIVEKNQDKEIKKLNEELSSLKEQLYTQSKNNEELQKENEKHKQNIFSNNKELIELRNIMFESSSVEIKEEAIKRNYPVEHNKRVVVIGGHDSFRNRMKELNTGNFTIIHPDANYDNNVIKTADLVVIQTNCIGHPQYYKTVDLVKASNAELLMLNNSSPKVCTEKICEKIK